MKIFTALLRLYPPEYRSAFASEMLIVLEEASRRVCRRKWAPYAHFVLIESFGLIRGAIAEWAVSLTTNSYISDQCLPGHADNKENLPAEVTEARRQVKLVLSQMEHAIANHQFEKARFYSEEERKARENLRLLQQKYQITA
ncbi:MAG: hypothetical protein ACJ73N_05885 [Bryobacteraceae bacterium]